MCRFILLLLCCAPMSALADGDGGGEGFDDLLAAQNEVADDAAEGFSEIIEAASEARVELPLERVMASRQALAAQAEQRARPLGPAVVLGEAHYRGEAIEGALSLTAEVTVTLGRPGVWKTVPLVGEDVVLVAARVGGRPVPVARRSGYHVWLTQQTGTVTLEVGFLVPATGPRGALEYGFTTVRTPVTRLDCTFPGTELAPRIEGAVQTEVVPAGERTRVVATLSPGLHFRLVGLKALANAEPQTARAYVEGDALLVLGARDDLFVTLRYTILHGGLDRFPIRLPPGYRVESVAGGEDFRHTIQGDPSGDLLVGELRSPVKAAFSVLLHLRRDLPADGPLAVAVPQAVGAERQSGWVAVEVPGKLRIEALRHSGASRVDVRRLPSALRQSAVSPILEAWRYEAPAFELAMGVQRLEERRVVPGVIDEVVAFTVVGESGTRLTEVRLLFKNRMRHRLAMRLPTGAQLRSALLDGNPVSASLAEDGRVMLPLIRSGGEDDDFELSVVLEEEGPAPGLFGQHDLALPALELPVSSLRWSVFLPTQASYTELVGEVAPQQRVGSVRWQRPFQTEEQPSEATASARAHQADAGTLPVRINLPRTGHRLNYHRYWIAAEYPVAVSTQYIRSWLAYPLAAVLAGLIVALVAVRRRWAWAVAAPLGAALVWLVGVVPLGGALVLALGLVAARRGWLIGLAPRLGRGLTGWIRARRTQIKAGWEAEPWTLRRTARVVGRVVVAGAVLYLGTQLVWTAGPLLWSLLG